MDQMQIENIEELKTQLRERGFEQSDALFSNARPLYTRANSFPAGFSIVDLDKEADVNSLGFEVTYRRMADSGIWHPEYAQYGININTIRAAKGYKSVNRHWFASEGPLPHKEYMRWIVQKTAKIETAKEAALAELVQLKPGFDASAISLAPVHADLDRDFRRLGFQPDAQWSIVPAYPDGLTFFQSSEKGNFHGLEQNYSFHFFFAVVNAELAIPSRVEYINATIISRDHESRQIISEEKYWLNEAGLPTKCEIVRDMKNSLHRNERRFSKAAELINRMDNNTTEHRSPGIFPSKIKR